MPGAPAPAAARRLAVLGLLTGIGYWTNFLSIVYVPAVLLRLALGRYRPRSIGEVVLPPLAFAIGALPHLLYTAQRGSPLPPFDVKAGAGAALARLSALVHAWPVLLGVPADFPGSVLVTMGAILTAVYIGLAGFAARASRANNRGGGADLAAVCCLVAANVIAVLVSRYGDLLWPRVFYLTPIWTALPVIVGAGLVSLPIRRRLVALVPVFLLAVHAAGIAGGMLRGNPPLPASILVERAPLGTQRGAAEALIRDGTIHLYELSHVRRDLTFVSGEGVIVSNYYEEALPRYARAVDGADPATLAWWVDAPSPPWPRASPPSAPPSSTAPTRPSAAPTPDFAVPPQPLRELDPDTLRAVASESAPAPPGPSTATPPPCGAPPAPCAAASGSSSISAPSTPSPSCAGSRASTRKRRSGSPWKCPSTAPSGAASSTSPPYQGPLDRSAGHPLGRVRSGRVELRVPPTPTRYVRPSRPAPARAGPGRSRSSSSTRSTPRPRRIPPPGAPAADLAAALAAPASSASTPTTAGAARPPSPIPTSGSSPRISDLDPDGWDGPRAELTPAVVWTPGAGALVEPVDAEGVARVAAAAGVPVRRAPLGDLVLFQATPAPPLAGRPLPAAALTLTASLHPETTALALDGQRTTRWATGRPQTPGDWLRVDLRAPVPLRALRLWTLTPLDGPRGLALEGSPDGLAWHPLAARLSTEGDLRWGGIALLRSGVEAVRLDFPRPPSALSASTLTRGDPVFDWSVHELTLFAE